MATSATSPGGFTYEVDRRIIFDGVDATDIVVLGPNDVEVTVPGPHLPGSVAVRAIVGAIDYTEAGAYEYVATGPDIQSHTPNPAFAGGPVTLDFYGANFVVGCVLRLLGVDYGGPAPAPQQVLYNPTLDGGADWWTGYIQVGTFAWEGEDPVAFTNGEMVLSCAREANSLGKLSVARGVSGQQFALAGPASVRVRFNISSASAARPVRLRVPGYLDTQVTVTGWVQYDLNLPAGTYDVEVECVSERVGDYVSLADISVELGGQSVSVRLSETHLQVTLPVLPSGSVTARVTNPDGQWDEYAFNVVGVDITNVQPSELSPFGGESVVVTGLNFQQGGALRVNGATPKSWQWVSPTEVRFTSDLMPTSGNVEVRYTNPSGDYDTYTITTMGSVPLPDFADYSASWLEIEGIPWAFGPYPQTAAYFSSRPDRYRRLGIKPVFLELPSGVDQEARPLEGDSSIGQLTARLQLDAAGQVLNLLANTRRRDLYLRLSADLPHASESDIDDPVTVACTGWSETQPYIDAYPAGGGIIYIGRETLTYTSRAGGTFSGCRRMRFEIAGHTGCYSHTASDIVTPYPRMVATRKARYAILKPDGTSIPRWAGTVVDARMLEGLTGVQVIIDSADRDVKVRRFTGQIVGKLRLGMSDGAGVYDQGTSGAGSAPPNTAELEPTSLDGREWTEGEKCLFRIGDEYVCGRLDATNKRILFNDPSQGDARGVLCSKVEQHAAGDDVKEVVWTGGYNPSAAPEDATSKFTRGDNPINLVLQIMCSRDGDGENGYFDVLPGGMGLGLGIDQARIDYTATLGVRDSWVASARHLELLEEPFNAKEKIAEILRPHLCYLVTTSDDRFVIKRVAPPLPGDTVVVTDTSRVVDLPGWDGSLVDVYGRVIWRCDWDAETGDYRQTYKAQFTDAQELYAGQFKTVDIDARGQWSGNDAGSGRFGSTLNTDAEGIARRYVEEVRSRYELPFPVLSIVCDYGMASVSIGDVLAVTLLHLPDVERGATGLGAALCEVIQKTMLDDQGKVEFVCVQTGYRGEFRRYAPCAKVTAVNGNAATVADHEYTNPQLPALDADHFKSGDKVRAFLPDLSGFGAVLTVVSVAGSVITLSSPPQVGDILMPADYAEVVARQLDTFAFTGSDNVYTG